MAEATLREALNASVTAAESNSTPSPATPDPSSSPTPSEPAAPVSPPPGGEGSPPAEPPEATPPAEPAASPDGGAAAQQGDKKPLRGAAAKAAEAKKAREAAEAAAGIRAPESWRPGIRDKHWKTLPPAVQAEIHRRERQVEDVLKTSAEARRGVEQVGQLFESYKDVFQYENAPPLQTVSNLLNAVRTLRFAAPPQKAQAMAQFIQGFGVDLPLLDQALAYLYGNMPKQQQANDVQLAVQNAVAPLNQYVAEQRSQQAQRQHQQYQQIEYSLQSELDKFAGDPANEYFEYVRDTMADIMESAANRNQKVSLAEAYHRACLSDNSIAQDYLAKRAQAVSAPAVAAAQKAALSVTGAPAQGNTTLPPGADVRTALNAAWAKHSAGS